MDLDTRLLRALVTVVDGGTVENLAALQSVHELEAELGQALLSPSTGPAATTPVGDRVVAHARRILGALADLRADVERTGQDLRVGYAWAGLGEHTDVVRRDWAATQDGDLVLVPSNTPTAGLLEGRCEVSVVRRPVADARLDSALIGTERRFAAVATDHRLADQETVGLLDLAGQTVAVDVETGSTSGELWQADAPPAGFWMTHEVEEWLALVASGGAVGISSEATVAQHPRPGVAYRLIEDAPPVPVWLAWWRQDPPASLDALMGACRSAYERTTG